MRAKRRAANSIAAGASVLGLVFCQALGGESKETRRRGTSLNKHKLLINKLKQTKTQETQGHIKTIRLDTEAGKHRA